MLMQLQKLFKAENRLLSTKIKSRPSDLITGFYILYLEANNIFGVLNHSSTMGSNNTLNIFLLFPS